MPSGEPSAPLDAARRRPRCDLRRIASAVAVPLAFLPLWISATILAARPAPTSSTEAMKAISDEEKVAAGISDISAPILSQVPNDPQQREKQLAEFEKIKAGF